MRTEERHEGDFSTGAAAEFKDFWARFVKTRSSRHRRLFNGGRQPIIENLAVNFRGSQYAPWLDRFSGHGFGIGPGAGRLMADLVAGDRPVVAPAAFRLSRFPRTKA